jgi:hypothetical protein
MTKTKDELKTEVEDLREQVKLYEEREQLERRLAELKARTGGDCRHHHHDHCGCHTWWWHGLWHSYPYSVPAVTWTADTCTIPAGNLTYTIPAGDLTVSTAELTSGAAIPPGTVTIY